MKKALPYIAIIGTSAFIGNLLVIGLGFGMYWQTLEPMEFMRQFGIQFPLLLAPIMGVSTPTLIALIVLVATTKQQKVVRKNWIIALVGLLIAFAITSIYHLPVNFAFMDLAYTPEEAASKLNVWLALHWVRAVFVVIAAIFSVKAFKNSLLQSN